MERAKPLLYACSVVEREIRKELFYACSGNGKVSESTVVDVVSGGFLKRGAFSSLDFWFRMGVCISSFEAVFFSGSG